MPHGGQQVQTTKRWCCGDPETFEEVPSLRIVYEDGPGVAHTKKTASAAHLASIRRQAVKVMDPPWV